LDEKHGESIYSCLPALTNLPECTRNAVKRDGVDTRVKETQAKPNDPARVPEFIEVIFGIRIEVEPKEKQM
jgi:hypothetical protein